MQNKRSQRSPGEKEHITPGETVSLSRSGEKKHYCLQVPKYRTGKQLQCLPASFFQGETTVMIHDMVLGKLDRPQKETIRFCYSPCDWLNEGGPRMLTLLGTQITFG